MVQDDQKLLHQISLKNYTELSLEIQRWREILAVPYNQYKSKIVPL